MRTLLLSLIFLIVTTYQSMACSIDPSQQYFCRYGQYTDYSIIRGEIVKEINQGIRIKVFEVYRGPATSEVITVWDDADFDCNGTLFFGDATNMGRVGETVLVYIQEITEVNNSWEKLGDYRNIYVYINNFPTHRINLVQKGNKIKGPITEGLWSVSVDKIAGTLRECIGESVYEKPIYISGDGSMNLYPNPARDDLFIAGSGEAADVQIFNLSGQLVVKKTIFIAEEGINVESLSPGVYICVAEIDGVISRKKFMVVND
jgi:hypothetical protein